MIMSESNLKQFKNFDQPSNAGSAIWLGLSVIVSLGAVTWRQGDWTCRVGIGCRLPR